MKDLIILIKGGGEMASGVAQRLVRSGFRVCMTELPEPLAVRRGVSFCEAVFAGRSEVEGLAARRVSGNEEVRRCWREGEVPIVIDSGCAIRRTLAPDVVVDAILAKNNTGTALSDAPLVIGLGPGFRAGRDAHVVIETNRGHRLGRVIEAGEAEPDTGIPGDIGGYTAERVLRAPVAGRFRGMKRIGDRIEKGEVVAEVEGVPLKAAISGVLRGILHDGLTTEPNMKVGDVDPRASREHCLTVSDKARAIAGAVLEAVMKKFNR
ncbi:MAG: EF2563 family selenium-dependent molybdenum hydroxylase system protein [Proteobacteria bacterium]|nr:EF2563 family selenium-dependent molybdenum hydroxylase system protein [Pseudomonadota bacterium]